MQDLAELQRRGFNRDQISDYVDDARSQGLNIGDRVQDSLNLMHKQGTLPGAIKIVVMILRLQERLDSVSKTSKN